MNWTYAKDDADWQQQVIERCHGKCTWLGCDSTWGLAGHHIFSRRYKLLRLVVENGCGLCAKHHNLIEQFPPAEKEKLSILLIGNRVYKALKDYMGRGDAY